MHPGEELKQALDAEDAGLYYPDHQINWQAETNPAWHPDQWAQPADRLYDDIELQQ